MFVPFWSVWKTPQGYVFEPLYMIHAFNHQTGGDWRIQSEDRFVFDLDFKFQETIKKDKKFWIKRLGNQKRPITIEDLVYNQIITCDQPHWLQGTRPVTIDVFMNNFSLEEAARNIWGMKNEIHLGLTFYFHEKRKDEFKDILKKLKIKPNRAFRKGEPLDKKFTTIEFEDDGIEYCQDLEVSADDYRTGQSEKDIEKFLSQFEFMTEIPYMNAAFHISNWSEEDESGTDLSINSVNYLQKLNAYVTIKTYLEKPFKVDKKTCN